MTNFIKSTEPFVEKSKQLRNLLWDEKETQLIQAFKALSQQLRGNEASALLLTSDIQPIKFLAEGNFGKVYEGLWSKTPVAIKVLKQGVGLEVQEEFRNEAALMLPLNHPRIVRCYGLCLNPLQAVFELMKGSSLENQLRVNQMPKEPFLDWSIRKQMLLDIGEAIHYVHAHQIVHGDLRAANFLVDENQRVKLGDFGLAKQRLGVMTVAFANSHDLGKLAWLAPELLSKAGERTFASDVYSFGMVIWELLTGYEPFGSKKGLSEEKLIDVIKKGDVLKYHVLPTHTPPWVVAIFEACLKSTPAERPVMSEILEVLFLAIDPQRYVKLYDTKTRAASSWLQDILTSLQSTPEVAMLMNSTDAGIADSDSEHEGTPDSDSDENPASVSSTASHTAFKRSQNASVGMTTTTPSASSSRWSKTATTTPRTPVGATPHTGFLSSLPSIQGSLLSAHSPLKTVSPSNPVSSVQQTNMPRELPSTPSSTKVNTSTPTLVRIATTPESGVIPPHLIHVDVTKKLGSGGFGVVYQGKYRGQAVAVKEILVQALSPKAQQEFMWESKTMLQLRDPSVVHLYGVTNESPYRMVLEFCELESLDRYLQKRPVAEVSWELRFHLSTGIASGLHYLHTYNPIIIHGDLKSLNVLLTGNPDCPKVKIGDFGMALLKTETQSKTTRTGSSTSKGLTVSWAAPELFSLKGKKTPASDMYAFGITLWEIATHAYPYANCPDPMIIRTSVVSGEREDVPENTPALFKKVMTDCWSQNPTDRPFAESVLGQLQAYEPPTETKPEEANQQMRPANADALSGGWVSSDKSKISSSRVSVSPVASSGAKNASVSSGKHSESPSSRASTATGDKTRNLFFQAAKNGDQTKLSTYQELLDDGLGTRDADGNTALHHAAANGHLALVKWLVEEQDQYPSESNDQGDTPLLLAARNGKQVVVEWLIELEDVDSGKRNNQDASALLLASEQGHLSLVAWLLENGHSQLKEQDKQHKTIFSSPNPSIVHWATLYREISKSPDVASSTGVESIVAYEGADAKLLRFLTLRLLVHSNARKLLKSYRERFAGWWSTFSEGEQLTLKPGLEATLQPQVTPSRPTKQSPQVIPVVFQPQPVLNPEPPAASLSYREQVEKMAGTVQDKINAKEMSALLKWVTEGHLEKWRNY